MGTLCAAATIVPPSVSPASRAFVDFRDHRCFRIFVDGAQRRVVIDGCELVPGRGVIGIAGGAEGYDAGAELDAEIAEQLFGDLRPAATREAVSRAEARSRMSRRSWRSYFIPPIRSTCPGRGACTRRFFRLGGIDVPHAHGCFPVLKSSLRTTIAIGEPGFRRRGRRPAISASSCSIFIRPPRP